MVGHGIGDGLDGSAVVEVECDGGGVEGRRRGGEESEAVGGSVGEVDVGGGGEEVGGGGVSGGVRERGDASRLEASGVAGEEDDEWRHVVERWSDWGGRRRVVVVAGEEGEREEEDGQQKEGKEAEQRRHREWLDSTEWSLIQRSGEARSWARAFSSFRVARTEKTPDVMVIMKTLYFIKGHTK